MFQYLKKRNFVVPMAKNIKTALSHITVMLYVYISASWCLLYVCVSLFVCSLSNTARVYSGL